MTKTRPLALAGMLVFGGVGALSTYLGYRDSIAAHAWTAASIGLGMGCLVTVILAAIGYAIGAYARRAAEREDRASAWGAAILGVFLAGVLVAKTVAAHRWRNHLQGVRAETLNADRARALLAGTRDERIALAYNLSCPPDVLARLAHDPDESIRAVVGWNPGTPPATLDELRRDASAAVRYYVSLNPAAKK